MSTSSTFAMKMKSSSAQARNYINLDLPKFLEKGKSDEVADWQELKPTVGFNPTEKEKRLWHWNFIGLAAARFRGV
jgi:hypothetical protein